MDNLMFWNSQYVHPVIVSNLTSAAANYLDTLIRNVEEYMSTEDEKKAETLLESHHRWPQNTLTEMHHDYSRQYVETVVALSRDPGSSLKRLRPLAEAQRVLLRDLDVPRAKDLWNIFHWSVLEEEFADFRENYLLKLDKEETMVYFRLVRAEVGKRMSSSELEELSVEKYNVVEGLKALEQDTEADLEAGDVVARYTQMIVRLIRRAWRDAFDDEVARLLRNPNVVLNVDKLVYVLYHAILFKHIDTEEREKAIPDWARAERQLIEGAQTRELVEEEIREDARPAWARAGGHLIGDERPIR